MHWYVYHSQKAMECAYDRSSAPVVFSTREQPKLCHGDTIWVVEGDLETPTNFEIADCFIVQGTDGPPFATTNAKFKLKVIGERSLLPKPISLNASASWFADLRDGFIKKQRFFCRLDAHPHIYEGLAKATCVNS